MGKLSEPTFAEFWMRIGARHDLVSSVLTRRIARCWIVRRSRCWTHSGGANANQQKQQRHRLNVKRHD